MPRLIFTASENGKLQMSVEGMPGANCVKVAEAFANRLGAPIGVPDLTPEYYAMETDQDLQQEMGQ